MTINIATESLAHCAADVIRTVEMIAPDRLIPHEDIDLDHAMRVASQIESDGIWLVPIAVEETSDVVMDGHHRLFAASFLSLDVVPVIRWSYEAVGVTEWMSGVPLDPTALLSAAFARRLRPIKSTRHTFPHVSACRVPLSELRTRAQTALLTFPSRMDQTTWLDTRTNTRSSRSPD